MSKGYKQLLGNRIYLELPPQEETKVVVDHNTREALQKAFKERLMRAKVFDIGSLVSELNISIGDEVLCDDKALAAAPVIPVDDNTTVILVSPYDIIHIW